MVARLPRRMEGRSIIIGSTEKNATPRKVVEYTTELKLWGTRPSPSISPQRNVQQCKCKRSTGEHGAALSGSWMTDRR
jgi:hypothetical protein